MIFILLFFSLFQNPDSGTVLVKNETTPFSISLYQPQDQINFQEEEVRFWENKLKAAPQQFAFQAQLANAYEGLFKLTGDINYLKTSEKLLTGLIENNTSDKAATLRSLAHNYISQHRFQEALVLIEKAIENGSNLRASQLMLIDIYEELGYDKKQKALLDNLQSERDFNYLIRLAKWEDGQGRLDRTIELMKEAEGIIEKSNQKATTNWVYSNLGDYYGHAGMIDLSEHYYKKALKLNPADWYSMKGLAWIAYAKEEDISKAMNIIQSIRRTNSDPSLELLQAELLEYQGEQDAAKNLRNTVAQKVSQADYGKMYTSFLVEYYAENAQTIDRTFQLAKEEIANRATPASYDLLAYAYFKNGEIDKAQSISKKHILGKTYEPGILINQVYYFQEKNDPAIEKIKEEIIEASYEIGPLTFDRFAKQFEV